MLNAKKLRMLRSANGWSQTQMLEALAKEQRAYCSQSMLRQYELGRIKNCNHDLLMALARLYDVSVEDLQD